LPVKSLLLFAVGSNFFFVASKFFLVGLACGSYLGLKNFQLTFILIELIDFVVDDAVESLDLGGGLVDEIFVSL
jgi:hypothetical protein